MSANKILFNAPLRERVRRMDVWHSTDTLPSWLATASGPGGGDVGSLPAGFTLSATGLEANGGYFALVSSGSETVGSDARVVINQTVAYNQKKIAIEFGGLVTSEYYDSSDTSATFPSDYDYGIYIAGGSYGIFLEHLRSVGLTQLRILTNNVARTVQPRYLEIIKNNGSKSKSLGIALTQPATNTWQAEVLLEGEPIFTEPLEWPSTIQTAQNRAGIFMIKRAGTASQYLRFQSIKYTVAR